MSNWQTIHNEEREGFDIVVSVDYEDIPLDCLFDDEEEIKQLAEKIDSGELLYFVVRVQAMKAGIELGVEYLGGNIYSDYKNFLEDNYFEDLADRAIEEAKKELPNLLKELAE